jgi:drug/metabolite transporter superfamily protein YnfA
MTNRSNLVTQISTTVAGFVLAAYGLAFAINTLNWL